MSKEYYDKITKELNQALTLWLPKELILPDGEVMHLCGDNYAIKSVYLGAGYYRVKVEYKVKDAYSLVKDNK